MHTIFHQKISINTEKLKFVKYCQRYDWMGEWKHIPELLITVSDEKYYSKKWALQTGWVGCYMITRPMNMCVQ